MGTRNDARSTRERILDTAGRLFYTRGFQAVGVDTIVAESGVAKMTLYRHFASKDDLIVAYLERSDALFWGWLKGATAPTPDPREKLGRAFEALEALAVRPSCVGCTFQATAAEFPDPAHPAHAVALAHKAKVRAWFRELAEEAGLRDPAALADELLLLMDGAWVAARMFGTGQASGTPVRAVSGAARALVEARS